MKKVTLYSSSGTARRNGATPAPGQPIVRADPPATDPADAAPPATPKRWRRLASRYERPLLVALGGLFMLALVWGHAAFSPAQRELTQQDIDAAVLHSLEHAQLPSHAAKAYEGIRRSVVRVHGIGQQKEKDGHVVEGIGTGVVIVNTGVILTNLHVVSGAERIEVEFDDGTDSEATVIGARPEHDLAVLQAKKLPDDLPAATLRSTADLAMGDEVIAVGFPFGIGPSVSAGVVSGLRREYDAKDRPPLTNLIQFDAAVNPGNSGGPLVTADGEVVGIVTAILNPTEQHVFIGIGFAVPIENAASAFGMAPF
jgi:S1-C subfamily serine protease